MIGNLDLIMSDSVTVLEAQQRTSRAGNTTPDWSVDPVEVGVYRAAVQGRSGAATVDDGRQGVEAKFRVYLDHDVPVSRVNRMAWGDRTLEVVGTPRIVQDHLRGTPHHLEVDAREALG